MQRPARWGASEQGGPEGWAGRPEDSSASREYDDYAPQPGRREGDRADRADRVDSPWEKPSGRGSFGGYGAAAGVERRGARGAPTGGWSRGSSGGGSWGRDEGDDLPKPPSPQSALRGDALFGVSSVRAALAQRVRGGGRGAVHKLYVQARSGLGCVGLRLIGLGSAPSRVHSSPCGRPRPLGVAYPKP